MQDEQELIYPPSKVSPPPPHAHAVDRPRLFTDLDRPFGLTLVVAPAGAGKTVLLSSWAGAVTAPRAIGKQGSPSWMVWYAMDGEDRDAVRFVDGLAAAVERAFPGAGAPGRRLLSQGRGVLGVLGTLLGALDAQAINADRPYIVLVLDDVHAIEGAPGAEEVLAFLVRHRPPSMRLILASRTIPLVPALAASAAGDLLVLSQDQLAFTEEEAGPLLAPYDDALDARLRADLLRTTGGWAFGLVLLARAQAGALSFLPQPQEALAEYLLTQVVATLSPVVRQFALESALLGWFTAQDADSILGRTDSAQRMADVVRAGLFVQIVPQDPGTSGPSAEALRYHDVLAGTLSRTLQRDNPARYYAIHQNAAAARRAADPLRALAHVAALGNQHALATILCDVTPDLRARGMWETLVRYGEMIPRDARPTLVLRMMAFGYYVQGQDGRALAQADAAYAQAMQEGDETAIFSAIVMRANPLLRQGRTDEVLACCLPALETARAAGNRRAEGWLAEICAIALMTCGRLDEGRALFADILSRRRADLPGGSMQARADLGRTLHNLGGRLILTGDHLAAEDAITEAISLARENGDGELLALSLSSRASLFLWYGQAREAAETAREAVGQARAHMSLPALHIALIVQALASWYLGHPAQAQEALAQDDDVLENMMASPAIKAEAEAIRARIALHAGDRAGARTHLALAVSAYPTGPAAGIVRREEGTLALSEGKFPDASRLLEEAATILGKYHHTPEQAIALCLRAEALWRMGKEARATACLDQLGALATGAVWAPGVAFDVPLALTSLRALSTHYWRLRGRGRQIAQTLLAAITSGPNLRLLPAEQPRHHVIPPGAVAADSSQIGSVLSFSPFGAGSISWGAGPAMSLARLGGDKTRELMAFALWKARPLSREEILDELWDGQSDEHTWSALHTASYQLRRFLGPEAWSGDRRGTYELRAHVVDDFRTLLALAVGSDDLVDRPAERAPLAARGLSIYHGGYLPWCYSLWTEEPRLLARSAALTLAVAQVHARARLGQTAAALVAIGEGLDIDPTHEELNTWQVHLLADMGRVNDAIGRYQHYSQLLEEGAFGPPSTALQSFVAQLGRS